MRCKNPVIAVICLILTLTTFIARSTTIIPFEDLGALTHYSDAVVVATVLESYSYEVRGETRFNIKLRVNKDIKGTLGEGEEFEVQKWEKVIDDKWMTMWGDIDLYEGASYLLFLEQKSSRLFHPLCFSYYIFEELTREGISYMVPSEGAREFTLQTSDSEPLAVYRKKELLFGLKEVVNGKTWDNTISKTNLTQDDFYHFEEQRGVPSNCTYMTAAGRNIRWNVFESASVGIHYTQGGAAGCSSSVARTQDAIQGLQASYPDINITDEGFVQNFANCADESAVGSDFRSWVSTNLGSSRNIVVFYDDPCDEVSDLSNCGGVLALGGLYSIGKHTFDGVEWGTGQFGYVILNDGLGTCKCNSQFTEVLMHEISHAIGLGHIASSAGTANMNPSCCSEVTSLDQGCMEYPYSSSQQNVLPLELISFQGEKRGFNNVLLWETAWEEDVEGYTIERADHQSGGVFVEVAKVLSKGNSTSGHQYQWIDYSGIPGENYYRLRNHDFDGSETLSQIITIEQDARTSSVLYPSVTSNVLHLARSRSGDARIRITDQSGKNYKEEIIQEANESIAVKMLPSGWYYLQLADEVENETYRFFKAD